jgi:hypothetical protein
MDDADDEEWCGGAYSVPSGNGSDDDSDTTIQIQTRRRTSAGRAENDKTLK